MEKFLAKQGIENVWGMAGGNCCLCKTCSAVTNEPCRHLDKSRTSLEAAGIDLMALQRKLGLDNAFYDDRVTWTGCLLY
jgi:predicted metal-binding protein